MDAFRDNFYDKSLGENMSSIYLKHEKAFEESPLKIRETLNAIKPITMNKIDEHITSKCFGFKDAYDYHYS